MVSTVDGPRPSGIPVLGEMPWGTHFCQFYQTKSHLLDVLVPYFQKGLETGEFCVWVTSEALTTEEARKGLTSVVPDLAEREARGQFEVFPYTDWYLKDGHFDMRRILDGWAQKYREGIDRGFAGLRVSGNTAWLEGANWDSFSEYEQSIDTAIEGARILVLCTYSLDRCGPYELLDVVRNHQFALVLGQRGWERIENAELRRIRELQLTTQEELRKTAEELARSNRELEQLARVASQARQAAEAANAAKDHFLAVLSHELRTPLTPALMTASALENDETLPAAIRDDMGVIRRSVELEVGMIDDLLDLNRIAHGKLALNMQVLDAHEKITSALEICRSEANSRGLHLRCELNAPEHHVKGDAGRLQQVIWNLLKNAIKFTPRGGRVEIRSCNPQPGRLRIEVEDTGIGIEPAAIPRLFSAFEQGNRQVTRQFGGLGLGLAICKSLMEAHAGIIQAESGGPGQGATFAVELPTIPKEPNASQGTAATAPQGERSLRILLVEDHPASAEVLSRLLTRAGHTVQAADSVRAALDTAEAFDFNLLISDLGLPDGNGYDLLRELKRRRPQTLGIALSGYGMDIDRERSLQAGFAEHLTKPVDMHTLRTAISRIASTSH